MVPHLNRKKIAKVDVDRYAEDIKKMNGDFERDKTKNTTDLDKVNEIKSNDYKAKNAKALIAAKAYVEAQDELEPSPKVDIVVAAINRMPRTKLYGGNKYFVL